MENTNITTRENSKITVGFTLTDQFNNRFYSESDIVLDFADDELNEIGRVFNNFLRQVGWIRRENFLLMTDISEEEASVLEETLEQMRKNNDNEE